MARTGFPHAWLGVALVSLVAAVSSAAQPADPRLDALTTKLELALDAAIEGAAPPAVPKAEDAARTRELKAIQAHVVRLQDKAKRGLPIAALEIDSVSQRLDRLMTRTGAAPAAVVQGEIPAGVELDVRLSNPSPPDDVAKVAKDGIVAATTLVDLRSGDKVLVPAGSTLRGVLVHDGEKRLLRRRQRALRFYILEIPGATFSVDLSVAGDGPRDQRVPAGGSGLSGGVLTGKRGTAATARPASESAIVRLRFNSPLTVQ